MVRFYEDALKEAAKYQLMVDFHGADKPTGLNRTFPNELTREGIRGLEIRGPWATHNTILPFTRYLAGPADFTPVTFSPKRLSETSWCHQVATAVIFTSPFLCYGVDPEQLLANPACDMVKPFRPFGTRRSCFRAARSGKWLCLHAGKAMSGSLPGSAIRRQGTGCGRFDIPGRWWVSLRYAQ